MLGISRRRFTALATVAGLALGAWGAGGSAQAGHCSQMLMFSGHTQAGTSGPKLNPGVGGCLLVNYEDENVNTNWFLPGANALSVGLSADPFGVDRSTVAVGDTLTAGEVHVTYRDASGGLQSFTVPLSLSWSGSRWNSQSVVVDGLLVRATATVTTQPGVDTTVTYRAVGEDS